MKSRLKPVVHKDSTVSYTKCILYPEDIYTKIKKLYFEMDFENITETILFILAEHEKNGIHTEYVFNEKKEKNRRKTIRLRENGYNYVNSIAKKKEIENFTNALLTVIYEYFDWAGMQ